MTGPWERIEGSSRDDELDSGVEARVADPLWMLARQWQLGEFRGDDAARPAAARLEATSTWLRSYRPGLDGPARPMPAAQPLERVVEAAPPPRSGAARLYWSARLGGQVSRRLRRAGLDAAVDALAGVFGLAADGDTVALPGAGRTAVEFLADRALDGAAIVEADAAAIDAALSGLADRDQARSIIERWRTGVGPRLGPAGPDTWQDTRQEHRFSVAAGDGEAEVVMAADEYLGGHLDWYSFDIDEADEHGLEGGETKRIDVAAIPTPVEYSGMPAPRWWAFEDGDVHFGDIAAGPGDLGRLLLADYATVYGDDWFLLPLRLSIGTVTRVEALHVHDTMGGEHSISPAALTDVRAGDERAFRLYELHGDSSVARKLAPLLFLPPSLAGGHVGPAVERVELVRDEGANLAWGIERLVEGPLGRPVDRLQHWRTAARDRGARDPAAGDLPPPDAEPPAPRSYGDEVWRYRLEATAPPFWIPFTPVRVDDGPDVRLRRARMQDWDLLDRALVGPKGELLRPDRPLLIEEEEVPRGGAVVERRWQTARWIDGSLHVWAQRSKRLGHGERSSGVRWDLIDENGR